MFHLVSGIALYTHNIFLGGFFTVYGLICIGSCVYYWLNDIVDEATFSGYHTLAVCNGLRLGFLLFIISETMLFFGSFWAFFHPALCPAVEIGSIFPPEGIFTIAVFDPPLYNTFISIISGISLT